MHKIPKLDETGFRKFALLFGSIIGVLFGIFFPWMLELKTPLWPWIVALCFILWGMVLPLSLEPVYLLWMKVGLMLNKVTTPVVLGILFYLILLPVRIIMQLTGHFSLEKKCKEIESYRVISTQNPKERMERPF